MIYLAALLLIIVTATVRRNKVLRTLLKPYLNAVGVCVNGYIYTPVTTMTSPENKLFDVVVMSKQYDQIRGYLLLSDKMFVLPLVFVPVGHRLLYLSESGESLPLPDYEDGTPFAVSEGKLSLQKRERRGIGFTYKEVSSSTSWPL